MSAAEVRRLSLAELRMQHFAGREGTRFRFGPSRVMALELVEVSGADGWFSLLFRSERDEGIVSELYTLLDDELQECGILLTRVLPPRGSSGDAAYYQAVFA